MNQQTEAQRLANTTPSLRGGDWPDKAATELRRLDADKDYFKDAYGQELRTSNELRKANKELLEALQDIARQPEGDEESAQAVARAAIAKHGGQQ